MNLQASKGFAHSLASLHWDVFATLTFANPLPSERRRWQCAWAHFQDAARSLGVPYRSCLIALRSEHGELGDRPHFHYLLGGTGAGSNLGLAFSLAAWWKRSTRGHAEIRPYDSRLSGADYVEGCLGGNVYELSKFNRADRLELSASVFKKIELNLRRGREVGGIPARSSGPDNSVKGGRLNTAFSGSSESSNPGRDDRAASVAPFGVTLSGVTGVNLATSSA